MILLPAKSWIYRIKTQIWGKLWASMAWGRVFTSSGRYWDLPVRVTLSSIASDYFLSPVSYISPWYAWFGVRTYEEINTTSLRIGDYEALKEAAIDPYVAFRDAYIQYRLKKVKARKAKLTLSTPPKEQALPADPALPEKEN